MQGENALWYDNCVNPFMASIGDIPGGFEGDVSNATFEDEWGLYMRPWYMALSDMGTSAAEAACSRI